VDEFATATVATVGVVAATAAAVGVAEMFDTALSTAATFGIAVHRLPPIDVIEAPAGRDMMKDSKPAPQRREVVSNEWKRN
jgi:hypothetical protein